MSEIYYTVCGACFLIALFLGRRSVSKHSGRAPLPPGPRLLPFVGNAFDIDISRPWLTYADWKEKYGRYLIQPTDGRLTVAPGDIVYSRVLNQDIVIISSLQVARDLLDKRSAIYSDRPQLRMNEEYVRNFRKAFSFA